MTKINLKGLIDEVEVIPSETRLVEALCNSGQTQLKTLNIGENLLWFEDSIMKASLLAFVKSQT